MATFFTFNFVSNMTPALVGESLPRNGPYITERILVFNGIEVREFNSSTIPRNFSGPGLLLWQRAIDTALYITSRTAINFLRPAIENLRSFLASPEIQKPSVRTATTKLQSASFRFGTNVTAYEGATITFKCVASGRPEPDYEFSRDSIPLNNTDDDEDSTVLNNTLILSDIKIDDTGTYMCIANNGVPPPAQLSSFLTVRNAVGPTLRPFFFPFRLAGNQTIKWPTSPASSDTLFVQQFMELVLACDFSGKPKPNVQWNYNDRPINESFTNFSIIEFGPRRSVLIINLAQHGEQLAMSNVNNFRCEGLNRGGTENGILQLQAISYECSQMGMDPCPITCGYGVTTIMYECLRRANGVLFPGFIPIDEVPFFVVRNEDRTTVCSVSIGQNPVICPVIEFRWNFSDWTDCSKTCGGGSRTRDVNCNRISIPVDNRYQAILNQTTYEEVVNDSMCVMFSRAKVRPISYELCNLQRCPIWRVGRYNPCSVTCGVGSRTRSVTCNVILGKYLDMNNKKQLNLTQVNDSLCNSETRPRDSKRCYFRRCPFQWRVGSFGMCNVLEFGVPSDEFTFCRQRDVFCFNEDPAVRSRVNDSFCSDIEEARPSTLASCGGGRCFNGIWEPLFWEECSKTCGYGNQVRDVICRSPDTLVQVPVDFCDIAEKPKSVRRCFLRNCDGECLRDEVGTCFYFVANNMCNTATAMGSSGLRCCASCMNMGGGD